MDAEQWNTSGSSSNTRVAQADAIEPAEDTQGINSNHHQVSSGNSHTHFAEPMENDEKGTVREEGRTHDRRILHEWECLEELGVNFSNMKKWSIIAVIALVQVSLNLNTSLYSNGQTKIAETFGVSEQEARCGAMIYLVSATTNISLYLIYPYVLTGDVGDVRFWLRTVGTLVRRVG